MYTAMMAALMAAGAILIFLGFRASNSIASSFSEFFTGSPTDKAVWFLIGGAVLVIAGLAGVWHARRRLQ